MTDFVPPPCIGHSCTRRTWIIAHKPGCVPEKKQPPQDGVESFLRELITHRPIGTRFTVAHLSHDFDLWVEDGHEMLQISDAMAEAEALEASCNGHQRIYEDGAGYICLHCGTDMNDDDDEE